MGAEEKGDGGSGSGDSGGGSGGARLGSPAYLKLVLHCLKYPQAAVTGLLLAPLEAAATATATQIEDAIPLFHEFHTLSTMLDVALHQVDAYAKQKGQMICGVYHANESPTDTDVPNHVVTLAATIAKSNALKAVSILLLNPTKLSDLQKAVDGSAKSIGCLVKLFQLSETKMLRVEDDGLILDGGVGPLLTDKIAAGAHRSIVDFDNHLEDISQDWRNAEILS